MRRTMGLRIGMRLPRLLVYTGTSGNGDCACMTGRFERGFTVGLAPAFYLLTQNDHINLFGGYENVMS